MPLARFEPTILEFERAKIFHALDRAATVTGNGPLPLPVKSVPVHRESVIQSFDDVHYIW
jgi:hypothetical protein